MRVLHLIDGGFRSSGEGVEAESAVLACRSLVERAGGRQWVCVLGPRSAVNRVERLGLRVDAAIAPTLGLPEAAWPLLRRLIASWGRPDLVQGWGPRPARLALRAMGDAVPRIAVLAEGEAAPADVALTFSEAAGQRLTGSGAEIARVVVVPPPAWEPQWRERDAVRKELGAADGDVLVAQLGREPQADAMRFTFLMSLLAESRSGMWGVVRGSAAGRVRAMAFGRDMRRVGVRQTRRPISHVLAACDLAVFDGGGPGPTRDWDAAPWAGPPALAPAHAAGVPVVAPAWALGDRPEFPSCVAYNSTLPELARRLLELAENPEERRRIAQESKERFGGASCGDGFVNAVREVWDDVVTAGAAHG